MLGDDLMRSTMNRSYHSDEFFHFVGHSCPGNDEVNYETLSKVIFSGCVSHPPHENSCGSVSYTVYWDNSLESEKLIVPTVTCYADIPFDCLGIHIKKYGAFGISFPRELLIQYGARPVMYVPLREDDWMSINGATLLKDLEETYKGFHDLVVSKIRQKSRSVSRSFGSRPATKDEAIQGILRAFTKDFLAFIKPFNSQLHEEDADNFYMEREWRKHGNLKFGPENVRKVVVARGFQVRLENDFPQYRGKVVEI